MRSPVARSALQEKCGLAQYRAWGRLGLSAIGPKVGAITMILVGLMVSGCSLMPRSDGPYAMASDADVTGSIATGADSSGPAASDLAFARDAASDVLTKGGKGASQPWQNPKTGAHGSVTPLDAAYTEGGHTCRDILASYVNGATQSWLQGSACKSAGGTWEIHTLKPWRQS